MSCRVRRGIPRISRPALTGKHLTRLAPSVEGKELSIGAAFVVQWRPAEPLAEAKTEIAVVLCKARWEAGFLWFCGESIGEARVRSLRLSR
jgi:hypothetical protein